MEKKHANRVQSGTFFSRLGLIDMLLG